MFGYLRPWRGGVSWGGELAASLQVTGYPSAVSCVLIGQLYIMEQDVFPGCTPPSIFSASRIILRKTSTAVCRTTKDTRKGEAVTCVQSHCLHFHQFASHLMWRATSSQEMRLYSFFGSEVWSAASLQRLSYLVLFSWGLHEGCIPGFS